MQNIITFEQSKKWILQVLDKKQVNMKKVILYHQIRQFCVIQKSYSNFDRQVKEYQQKIIEIVNLQIERVKQQLLKKDQINSLNRHNQIRQISERIYKQNSLNDLIKAYEEYYQAEQLLQKQNQNIDINNIKMVPDQKSLIQVIERGFLNCKFIKSPQKKVEKRKTLSREEYLNTLNNTPTRQQHRTPIATLNDYMNTEQQLNPNSLNQKQRKQHQLEFNKNQNIQIDTFQHEQNKIINIKKQQRPSIFKNKQNDPIIQLKSSNTFLKQNPKEYPRMSRQQLFSDVKKYQLSEDKRLKEQQKRQDSYQRPINIYTQNLNFQSYPIQVNNRVHRSSSNQSLGTKRSKGISLVKKPFLEMNHYQNKQKLTIFKMKQRLRLTGNNQTSRDSTHSLRDCSVNWKRVVNLSDSNASWKTDRKLAENTQSNIAQGIRKNVVSKPSKQYNQPDVLNPMEMRQLLIRKKLQKNPVKSTNNLHFLPNHPTILLNSRLHTQM